MNDNQHKNMTADRLVTQIEYLAVAGAKLAIDADGSDPLAGSMQAIFEAIEGAAADLQERLA